MRNTKVMLESRKIKGNDVIEVYRYVMEETKDEFFKHYKIMQGRNFKNDRSKDFCKDGFLYATYVKNVSAKAPVAPKNHKNFKKKGRA